MTNSNLELTSLLLEKHFELITEQEITFKNTIDLTELQTKLAAIVFDLLNIDFEKLLQILYRIDVSQQKFEKAMQAPSLKDAAWEIANLMIDREMEKVIWRQKYK